jgi:hypothetical protein
MEMGKGFVFGILFGIISASVFSEEVNPPLLSKGQIVADIPGDSLNPNPLELGYAFPVPSWNQEELFVTLHRGKRRPDRVAVWQRAQGKFRRLLVLEAEEGREFSYFDQVTSFRYKDNQFLHVPLIYTGTGHIRKDRIYCVLPSIALQEITFQPAPEGFSKHLKKGEGIWKGENDYFSDERLAFEFYIWKEGDGNCCPSAGKVTGTYKIFGDVRWDPKTNKQVADFKMLMDTFERTAVKGQ